MITFQNTSLKKKLYHSALSVIYSFCFNCWNSFINTKVTETKLFQSFFYFYKGHCSTTAGNISRFGLFGFFFFSKEIFKVQFYFCRIPKNPFSHNNETRSSIDIKVQRYLFSEYPDSE